jgi:replicative DNA helicase
MKSKTQDLYDAQAEELFLQHMISNPASTTEFGDVISVALSAERAELGHSLIVIASNQDAFSDEALRINGASESARSLFAKISQLGLPSITVSTLIKRLRDVASRREIALRTAELFSKATEGSVPAEEIIEIAELMSAKARDISNGDSTGGGYRSMHDMDELIADMQWRCANPNQIKGYSFGYPKLERLLDGLQPSKLYLLGARPSVGKTALAGNIVSNLANNGIGSVVFSLEMPDREFRQRLLTSVCGVNPTKSLNGQLTKKDLTALRDGMSTMKKWDVYIDDTDRMNIELLRAIARRSVYRDGAKVIIIDYIQLLRGVEPKSRNSKHEEVSEVSGKLKALAKELRVPIIALAQLKRTGNAFQSDSSTTSIPRPTLESLKDSGSLEQDADTVILLHRDPSINASEADAIIAKNRSGSTGECKLTFHNDITTFKETFNPANAL